MPYTRTASRPQDPGKPRVSLNLAPHRRPTSTPRASRRRDQPVDYAAMRVLWETSDLTAALIGERFGISKNAVIGLAGRGEWIPRGGSNQPPPSTLMQRMDALHATMDALLAATRGIGRVPNA